MTDKKASRTAEEKAMNDIRRKSMRVFEDKFAEPPPYTPQSTTPASSSNNGGAQTGIPTFETLNFQPSPLEIPTPIECIAHLKLLHAFAKLRHDVGNQEGLFGISMGGFTEKDPAFEKGKETSYVDNEDAIHPVPQQPDMIPDAMLAERIRDKRWAVFVNKAVDRFEKWWQPLTNTNGWYESTKMLDFESISGGACSVSRFTDVSRGYEIETSRKLPPLDVLMVWHAYMLNPRTYLEDCLRFNKHQLWQTLFPWDRIYAAIDNETFEYKSEDLGDAHSTIPWNSLEDESPKEIICPTCVKPSQVPWTVPPASSSPEVLESYLANDIGYSGAAFTKTCSSCGLLITHEKLRVGKFINDADLLIKERMPLTGTVLNIWGGPAVTSTGKKIGTHDIFFPNRVVITCPQFQRKTLRTGAGNLTVEKLKSMFATTMSDRRDLTYANKDQYKPEFLAKSSRIAVRKVLSHYWENSSIFGIDLVGAVLRQGSFVQKMKKIDWLHSPNVISTMQRLIVKYHRFVRLAADYPKKTIVPTLDVDLAWHTQQLTPRIYYRYTMAETKNFLNHDDKIPESSLHTSFQWTSKVYEKKYGQPYSECSCWYCECTREPLRSNFLSKISPRRASLSLEKLDEKGFPKTPDLSPHVSAHNAYAINTASNAAQKRRELEELDLQYAKVCKRYQKQKAAETPRKEDRDAYVYGAYGYPMYYPMPVYVPYYADPSCQDSTHAADGGTVGGCVAGTCAGSTSLGGCAGGDGTPGCKASCGGHGSADGGCGTCSGGGDGGGGCGGGCGGGGD